ncbi:hypothetical protein [Spartinivicinus poritis]|uniref:Baseplate protein J-like domain-containing protein n=1 Tax=Spartinivicinus poritis TaxID=2994640 RepID=A0ABT5U2S8_9GAMM|nr:hypothetical protein [Spartinivicinus sp. A2-2]MDE1460673.1 hypothetical protein [Spartinivicinus sp. A2-2]
MRDSASSTTNHYESKRQGCTQSERLSIFLKSGYLLPEERSIEDWLVMGVAFAKEIKFIDENNQHCGNWAGLLNCDETILLALISQKNNTIQLEEQFLTIISGRYDESLALLAELVELNVTIVKTINQWYEWSKQRKNKVIDQLQAKLLEVIQFHRPQLNRLRHWLALSISNADAHQAVVHTLKAVINDIDCLGKAWRYEPLASNVAEKTFDRQQLENFFHSLQQSIGYLSDFAKPLLKASLQVAQHEPASALFIGFILLLAKVRAKTDHFIDEHQYFYYNHLLKLSPKASRSDYTQLILSSHKKTTIPQGTVFICEADDQHDELYYQSERPVMVVDGTVAQLANIYIQHDPLNVPGYNLGFVTNIHGQYLDEHKLISHQAQSLFGAPLIVNQQTRREKTAVGFAIGSNILQLKQGLRQIVVNLVLEKRHVKNTVDDNSYSCSDRLKRKTISESISHCLLEDGSLTPESLSVLLDDQCSLLTEGAKQRYKQVYDSTQTGIFLSESDKQWLLEKIFDHTFQISLTSEEGWHFITSYDIELVTPKQSTSKHIELAISFQLPRSAPAIVSFDQTIHCLIPSDQYPDQLTPVIRFLLKQDSFIYSYSLLADLVLLQADIQVDVTGLKDLQLYNDLGPVNPASPFMPFGAQPHSGSGLIIGSNEFSYKTLTQLSFDLEWSGLPKKRGGFETYYKAYDLGITNASFQVYPQILQDGLWYPESEASQQQGKIPQPQVLFTIDQEDYLSNWQTITFSDLELFKPAKNSQKLPLNYTTRSMNGFVRLQLTGTEHGFAHKLYPIIMGQKMTETVRLKLAKPPDVPAPYTPVIARINANYQANTSIHVEKIASDSKPSLVNLAGEIYTLYPFGCRSFSEKIRYETGYLLPQYLFQGALYIGIQFNSIFTGGRLSLLIDVDAASVAQIRHTTGTLKWAFLKNNIWFDIDGKYVLTDDTNSFLTPGIITLELPEEMIKGQSTLAQQNNDTEINCHLMSPDLFWLRVSTDDNPGCYCQLRDVKLNGVRVRWLVNPDVRRPANLAADNQFKLQQSIEGITAIAQPLPSVGGRLKESATGWSQRCAERLRHRGRAIQTWDFERIVLEHFPNIERVKCFTAQRFQQPHQVVLGSVLLIVIPKASHLHEDSTASQLSQPAQPVSAIELERIKQTLQARCNPGITVEVANPIYERIQLRCSVVFNTNASDINGHSALNDAISHYLSAWGKYRFTPPFDWVLQPDMIEAFIRDLPYIAYVTNLSLIKVTPLLDGRYELFDSVVSDEDQAAPGITTATTAQRSVNPKYPWGIALPFAQHGIESKGQTNDVIPDRTGVDELALGASFVIGR